MSECNEYAQYGKGDHLVDSLDDEIARTVAELEFSDLDPDSPSCQEESHRTAKDSAGASWGIRPMKKPKMLPVAAITIGHKITSITNQPSFPRRSAAAPGDR